MEIPQTKNRLAETTKRYEHYKESGVEWLGKIPEHWEALSNKFIFDLKKIQVGKKSNEYDLLSLTLRGIVIRNLEGGGKFPAEFDTYQEVKKGDFVFCLFDVEETPRCVGLSDYDGMITGAYTVMETNENFDRSFLYYFYLNLDADKRMKPLYTGLRNTISKDNFFAFKTFVPPLQEQTAIAQFLDDKTQKIDAAVALKEQQIKLLQERKQILIHKAVTRGLDDTVKLKDSGVEWIGKIPEHWEVKKLKYILNEKLKYGANESGVQYDINLPRYVRITDFGKDGKLGEENKLSLSWNNGGDYLLKDGDILFARSGATVGKTYQFKKSMSVEKYYCFAGYLIKAEANEEIILSDFLYLYTNSELFNKWKDSIFIKATIENIGADKYSQLFVIIPPIREQKEILCQYESASQKIETAISLKQQEIEKLKEYKSSLINSVVTGKVKVN
ncbi:restriction endonuclease subunit S [Leeuwenhoekiella aequorea]|uniref:Type I restriction enzyme S subunit n=1 Tax=Leeuwenhoekiella aequorea TaxID=283736 RepID=A0A4Q0P5N3_9FLAO|nr:restriction endonuclease subunit S [Leeuwenhoekiella aequorea]RXG21924.1 type I restriction enzyme S subunit [Leeuwenhoekiella aequorea]